MFARWVDLGCPINTGELDSPAAGALGWFADDQRPALTVSSPRPNINAGPLTEIRVGVADAYSGINATSLSIKADFPVNGRAVGAELADLATQVAPGVHSIALSPPIDTLPASHITARVADQQGNIATTKVRFWVGPDRLEVRELDGSGLPERRFRLRFIDTRPDTPRRILYSTDLQIPRSAWNEAQILSEAWTAAGECWAEVAIPAGAEARCFFSIERD